MDECKDTNASESELNAGLDLIYGLIFSTGSPEATELVKNNEQFSQIYDYLVELRQIVISFAKGDFTKDVKLRGFLGGSLKNLQANLRHLSWQVEMVAAGDFSQRVDFMGEFSTAFNSMVIRLHQSLEDLRQQEELLTAFTESLKQEIAVRIKAEEALRLSEERYRTLAALDPLTGHITGAISLIWPFPKLRALSVIMALLPCVCWTWISLKSSMITMGTLTATFVYSNLQKQRIPLFAKWTSWGVTAARSSFFCSLKPVMRLVCRWLKGCVQL